MLHHLSLNADSSPKTSSFSITDASGTRSLSYNVDGSLASEGTVGYTYDALGRRITMSVASGPATSYTYDAMSRLATVSDGTRSASYSRISGSSLLASTTINNGTSNILTATRTYDMLDRLTNITSNGISYNYTYDNSDKRTRNTLSDGSYWVYEYDDLGQVTKGKKYTASGVEVVGQSFGYDYDDIGNLKTENRNGNVFKYTANSVNQYTERTVPSRINISGSADAASTVTIKQGSTYTKPLRYGNYFNAFFTLDNSSSSVSDTFDVYAVKYDSANSKDIVAKQTLNVFIPKTPEQFTYDNDGNLLTDGRFVYSWNGENRLVSAVETGKQKIDFIYDYMGRRINKKVYSWNGSAWILDSETKFVYDRYNIVAEFDGSNNLLNSYLWGEDVSGSLEGAGGVGGLLAVNNYLPVYDGNGNVMSYINATNGTVCAEYQYNPFGKIISKSGTNADSFKMLFSTKYYDKETETFYYLYRDYKPEISRWLSRDPIDIKGGLNIYCFVENNGIDYWDILGLWKKVGPLKDEERMMYIPDSPNDTKKDLADLVGLDVADFDKWAKKETKEVKFKLPLLPELKIQIPCGYSVPNVWISADLLRGGGLWDGVVNMGGSIGQFIGTDLLTSNDYKVIKPTTIQSLTQSLKKYAKNIWGMVVYAHGTEGGDYIVQPDVKTITTKDGTVYLDPSDKGRGYIGQTAIRSLVSLNTYKLGGIYMMQCYSAAGSHGPAWEKLAVKDKFFGYKGVNALLIDFR